MTGALSLSPMRTVSMQKCVSAWLTGNSPHKRPRFHTTGASRPGEFFLGRVGSASRASGASERQVSLLYLWMCCHWPGASAAPTLSSYLRVLCNCRRPQPGRNICKFTHNSPMCRNEGQRKEIPISQYEVVISASPGISSKSSNMFRVTFRACGLIFHCCGTPTTAGSALSLLPLGHNRKVNPQCAENS